MNFSILPPELWDLILMKIVWNDTKIVGKARLLSKYFNELILSNRDLKFTLTINGPVIEEIIAANNSEGGSEYARLLTKFEHFCGEGILDLPTSPLDLCRWMVERFQFSPEQIKDSFSFYNACSNGELKTAKWLTKTFNLTLEDIRNYNDDNVFSSTCENGHLEVAEWLVKTFNLSKRDAMVNEFYIISLACGKGHLKLAKWLKDTFILTEQESRECGIQSLSRSASSTCDNRLEICKWVVESFNLTERDIRHNENEAFRMACLGSQYDTIFADDGLEVCRWLVDTFNLTSEDAKDWDNRALRVFCRRGHLEHLKWFHEKFHINLEDLEFEDGSNAFGLACDHNRLETAKWLKNTFNLDSDYIKRNNNLILKIVIYEGNSEICKWLFDTFNLTINDLIVEERDEYSRLDRFNYTKKQLKILKFILNRYPLD